MCDILRYKGYVLYYKGCGAEVEYSKDDGIFYGKIAGIRDLVTFEADSEINIENEFHKAVDEYIALCADVGKTPETSKEGAT